MTLVESVQSAAPPMPAQHSVTYLADITANSGTALKGIVLGIVGTALIILIVVKVFAAFAEEKYARMITLFLAGCVVAWLVYFPDTAITVMKNIGTSIGSGT